MSLSLYRPLWRLRFITRRMWGLEIVLFSQLKSICYFTYFFFKGGGDGSPSSAWEPLGPHLMVLEGPFGSGAPTAEHILQPLSCLLALFLQCCSAGHWTQSLIRARQVLSCWATVSWHFYLFLKQNALMWQECLQKELVSLGWSYNSVGRPLSCTWLTEVQASVPCVITGVQSNPR